MRDRREDVWDAQLDGGKWDCKEVRWDHREDVRDRREGVRDLGEDRRDRCEDVYDLSENRCDRREDVYDPRDNSYRQGGATESSLTGTAAATSHNAPTEPVAVAVAIKVGLIEGAVFIGS